jgi:hypothetical protein
VLRTYLLETVVEAALQELARPAHRVCEKDVAREGGRPVEESAQQAEQRRHRIGSPHVQSVRLEARRIPHFFHETCRWHRVLLVVAAVADPILLTRHPPDTAIAPRINIYRY